MTNRIVENKYCSECEHLTRFEEIKLVEKVKVKNSLIENEHTYYKCNQCGELFEPFDDPDYNARLDFEKYKKLNGLLSSNEIKEIRLEYSLTLRQMADLIGISYSTLSEIENGSIQSKLLNSMLTVMEDPFSVRALYKTREKFLTENFDDFLTFVDYKCIRKEETLSEVSDEVRNRLKELKNQTNLLREQTNDIMIRFNNNSEYYQGVKNSNEKKENGEHGWREKIFATLKLT